MTDPVQRPDSAPVLITMSSFESVTPRGAVTGAWIMGQLDRAAGLAGMKISGGDALILSIKELTFLAVLPAGVEFAIHSELTRKGNSSFTVALSGWADVKGESICIFRADVVLVAVDEDGRPRKLA